jgi:glycerol uptake facilitator-like aquaporin
MLTEILATFVFVNVIVSIKYHWPSNELFINAIMIGLSLFAMINVSGNVSGGCLNPAIGIVQTIFQRLVTDSYWMTYSELNASGLPIKEEF